MSKRRHNPRLAKTNRSYDVGEVAILLGIHKNTVRTWIKEGLPVADDLRPTLVLGKDLRAFLENKRSKNKQPCRLGELYCFRCRAPRKPAANMADFEPATPSVGKLTALCEVCETIMHQRIGMSKLKLLEVKIDITFTQLPEHIGDRHGPFVNSDFKRG